MYKSEFAAVGLCCPLVLQLQSRARCGEVALSGAGVCTALNGQSERSRCWAGPVSPRGVLCPRVPPGGFCVPVSPEPRSPAGFFPPARTPTPDGSCHQPQSLRGAGAVGGAGGALCVGPAAAGAVR